MSSTAKPQKDKPHGATPRLVPRPTAASTARAAQNLKNRNLIAPVKVSPSRASSVPHVTSKEKYQTPVTSQKTDSKTDLKVHFHPPRNFQKTHPSTLQSNKVQPQINRCIALQPKTDQVKEEKPEMMNITVIVTDMPPNVNNVENDGGTSNEANENNIFDIKYGLEDIFEQFLEISEARHGSAVINELQPSLEPFTNEQSHSTPMSRSSTPATSRPHTPRALSSRPLTPRTNNSRPHSPYATSRPSTPGNLRQASATSRPVTPQDIDRPCTPRSLLSSPNRPKTASPQRTYAEDDIKSVFTMKQKQFHRLKKELDLKQQATLEVFETLRSLRERMCREGLSGSGEGQLQELVLFNVGDWTAEEVAQLCRDAAVSSLDGAVELLNTAHPIEECTLQELDSNVMSIPSRFADLCLQSFTARQELIDMFKELVENNALREEVDKSGHVERIARYNTEGLYLCESLRELKSRADGAVETIMQLARRACQERSALIAVGESLVREIARLRQDIEMRMANIADINEEVRRELEEEKAARAAANEKLVNAESQLKQTRARVTKMDRQLREAEASIVSLTSTVKSLEDQTRQKEVQMEARARKLKETLKTGEMTTSHLSQQRETLQTEIAGLKEKIANLNIQHKSAIQELANHLKESKAELEAQRKVTKTEAELKITAEKALEDSANVIKHLRERVQRDLGSEKNCSDLPTEKEIDLLAELQSIKDTLRLTEEEVTACKREKNRFLETLTKIAETDGKVGMQQKLAGELLNKEEIMGKMQTQIRELTKNTKLNEQKVIQYEQFVRDLQAHNRNIATCQEPPDGISYEDLQQEVMNLKINLLESVHRNEELSELLALKDQQIEQQDKTSRAQARVIKVREELINMLKNKEIEQSRELTALQQDLEHRMKIVEEVNKQIAAKADEIQELFGTLENKQQQIHRLEKIVLALEEQQRRAQAQRIRHEEKIAALEHELAAGGNRRERKFLFF